MAKLFGNLGVVIVMLIALIFIFGGGQIIFNNPAIIIFAILAFAIAAWSKGK